MKRKLNEKGQRVYCLLVALILLLALLIGGCSTTGASIKVFGGEKSNVLNSKNLEFTTVDIVENVYPPANKVCVEKFQLNKEYTQCTKFVNWLEYVEVKFPEGKLIKMEYKYNEKLMIIYVKE